MAKADQEQQKSKKKPKELQLSHSWTWMQRCLTKFISTTNPATYKTYNASWRSWVYLVMQDLSFNGKKSVNGIHYINQVKEKTHVVISIDADNILNKIPHLFVRNRKYSN